MENKKQSQQTAILNHLRKGGTLTSLTAVTLIGTIKLTTRISELRAKGFPIADKWVEGRNGKRWKQYYMEPKKEND